MYELDPGMRLLASIFSALFMIAMVEAGYPLAAMAFLPLVGLTFRLSREIRFK